MGKTFRAWDVDRAWLLPPSVHRFVPPGHLAHFVRDTVRGALDVSAITGVYKAERGQPPCRPGVLVALLLYGYSRGLCSSRQLARACEERVDVVAVTGLNRPDFRTVGDFRKRHLPALRALFVQVLRLCQAAGLVKLGHVAVDGTKLRADAGEHKATGYKHTVQQEPRLAAGVASWLGQADAADAAGDAQHGSGCRGDETPDWPDATRRSGMADKQRRLERFRAAKAQPEAEAKAGPDSTDPDGPGPSSGVQERGARKDKPTDTPPDKARRNLTALVPLVDRAHVNLGRRLREVSGDTGFATGANLEATAGKRRPGSDGRSPGQGLSVAGPRSTWRKRPNHRSRAQTQAAGAGRGRHNPQGWAPKSIPAARAGC